MSTGLTYAWIGCPGGWTGRLGGQTWRLGGRAHLGDFSMRFYRLSIVKFDQCTITFRKGRKQQFIRPLQL